MVPELRHQCRRQVPETEAGRRAVRSDPGQEGGQEEARPEPGPGPASREEKEERGQQAQHEVTTETEYSSLALLQPGPAIVDWVRRRGGIVGRCGGTTQQCFPRNESQPAAGVCAVG